MKTREVKREQAFLRKNQVQDKITKAHLQLRRLNNGNYVASKERTKIARILKLTTSDTWDINI